MIFCHLGFLHPTKPEQEIHRQEALWPGASPGPCAPLGRRPGAEQGAHGSRSSTFPAHWDSLVENLQSVHEEGAKHAEEIMECFFAELLPVLLRFRHHLRWASLCAYSHYMAPLKSVLCKQRLCNAW